MLDTVKINHVQHISFTQSRLTDAVSVILSELLSYEHPSNGAGFFPFACSHCGWTWSGLSRKIRRRSKSVNIMHREVIKPIIASTISVGSQSSVRNRSG